MEKYSKKQIAQLTAANQQIEARLTRTRSAALTNEWIQKQVMRNYQSEYDRIRNELSNSAMPFQTQESVKHRMVELEKIKVKIYNIIS